MKVLQLASWYSMSERNASGWFLHSYSGAVQQVGHESEILFINISPFNFNKGVTKRAQLQNNATEIAPFGLPKLNGFLINFWAKRSAEIFEKYYKANDFPDIIHAHSFLAAIQANQIRKKLNIPFVYTEHLSSFLTDTVPRKYNPYIIEATKEAKLCTAVSQELCDKMQKETKRSFKRVFNPVDTVFFNLSNIEAQKQPLQIFALGDPPNIKGLDRMLNLCKILVEKKIIFNIVIGDQIRDANKWKRQISKMKIEEHVEFCGFLKREEIYSILKKSDLFLSLSRVETFGLAIAEAISCGIPVITTNVSGPNDYFNDDLGVIFNYNNELDAWEALREYLSRKNTFDRHKIRFHANNLFSFKKIGKDWLKLYKRTLQNEKRR